MHVTHLVDLKDTQRVRKWSKSMKQNQRYHLFLFHAIIILVKAWRPHILYSVSPGPVNRLRREKSVEFPFNVKNVFIWPPLDISHLNPAIPHKHVESNVTTQSERCSCRLGMMTNSVAGHKKADQSSSLSSWAAIIAAWCGSTHEWIKIKKKFITPQEPCCHHHRDREWTTVCGEVFLQFSPFLLISISRLKIQLSVELREGSKSKDYICKLRVKYIHSDKEKPGLEGVVTKCFGTLRQNQL